MKALKLLLILVIPSLFFTSCTYDVVEVEEEYIPPAAVIVEPIAPVLNDYELWYVDYNETIGRGDVRFTSLAFTLSFINGRIYANNNIVDIGRTGDGFGVYIGTYNTYNNFLEIDHIVDGFYEFEVIQTSRNTIELYNAREDVTYFLEGYQRNDFNYDLLFYDNIEYLLQEFQDWEKIGRSNELNFDRFDEQNYLGFTPENITTFYASVDPIPTQVGNIRWDYVGAYEVYNVEGFDDLKILTFDYDLGDTESFELTVINDGTIQLLNRRSKITYEFEGRAFTEYLRQENLTDEQKSIQGRKRTIVKRKTIKK